MMSAVVLTVAMCLGTATDYELLVEKGELMSVFKVDNIIVHKQKTNGVFKNGVWKLKCARRNCDVVLDLSRNKADVVLNTRELVVEEQMECAQAID